MPKIFIETTCCLLILAPMTLKVMFFLFPLGKDNILYILYIGYVNFHWTTFILGYFMEQGVTGGFLFIMEAGAASVMYHFQHISIISVLLPSHCLFFDPQENNCASTLLRSQTARFPITMQLMDIPTINADCINPTVHLHVKHFYPDTSVYLSV